MPKLPDSVLAKARERAAALVVVPEPPEPPDPEDTKLFVPKKGGKPKTIMERKEREEFLAALDRMEPRALERLEEQLEHPDPRIVQSAMKLIMEYRRGKPAQTIRQQTDTVQTIRFESAAFRPMDYLEADAS